MVVGMMHVCKMWVSMDSCCCCLVVMQEFRMHLRRYKADRCMWHASSFPANHWNSSIDERWINIAVYVTGMTD